jgi:hypothetical protein
MLDLNGWDWALLIGGGYLALVSLVRLMRRRHDAIVQEVRAEVEMESRRQQMERKRERASRDEKRPKAA